MRFFLFHKRKDGVYQAYFFWKFLRMFQRLQSREPKEAGARTLASIFTQPTT